MPLTFVFFFYEQLNFVPILESVSDSYTTHLHLDPYLLNMNHI